MYIHLHGFQCGGVARVLGFKVGLFSIALQINSCLGCGRGKILEKTCFVEEFEICL